MNDGAAGKIEYSEFCQPAAAPPYPVSYRAINNGKPQGGEEEKGSEFNPFDDSARNQSHGNNGEHALKDGKSQLRDRGSVTADGSAPTLLNPAKLSPPIIPPISFPKLRL